MKTEKYYFAVLFPNGRLIYETIRARERESKEAFLVQAEQYHSFEGWQGCLDEGYKIEKVCVIKYLPPEKKIPNRFLTVNIVGQPCTDY